MTIKPAPTFKESQKKEPPTHYIRRILEDAIPNPKDITNMRDKNVSGRDWVVKRYGKTIYIDDKTDSLLGITGRISFDIPTTEKDNTIQLIVNEKNFPKYYIFVTNKDIKFIVNNKELFPDVWIHSEKQSWGGITSCYVMPAIYLERVGEYKEYPTSVYPNIKWVSPLHF